MNKFKDPEWDGSEWDHPTITWNEMLNMMQNAADPKGLRREIEAGCAGRPIARGMISVSSIYCNGYIRFQSLAEATEKEEDKESMKCFTIACILFAIASIDAALSERIAISREIENPDTPPEFWEEVDKASSTRERWNMVAQKFGGEQWDGSKNPFQAHDTIRALRNELCHVTPKLMSRQETPRKRIGAIIKQIGEWPEADWVDEIDFWTEAILTKSYTSIWCAKETDKFHEIFGILLFGYPKDQSQNHYQKP